jgi:hypothetical protein
MNNVIAEMNPTQLRYIPENFSGYDVFKLVRSILLKRNKETYKKVKSESLKKNNTFSGVKYATLSLERLSLYLTKTIFAVTNKDLDINFLNSINFENIGKIRTNRRLDEKELALLIGVNTLPEIGNESALGSVNQYQLLKDGEVEYVKVTNDFGIITPLKTDLEKIIPTNIDDSRSKRSKVSQVKEKSKSAFNAQSFSIENELESDEKEKIQSFRNKFNLSNPEHEHDFQIPESELTFDFTESCKDFPEFSLTDLYDYYLAVGFYARKMFLCTKESLQYILVTAHINGENMSEMYSKERTRIELGLKNNSFEKAYSGKNLLTKDDLEILKAEYTDENSKLNQSLRNLNSKKENSDSLSAQDVYKYFKLIGQYPETQSSTRETVGWVVSGIISPDQEIERISQFEKEENKDENSVQEKKVNAEQKQWWQRD